MKTRTSLFTCAISIGVACAPVSAATGSPLGLVVKNAVLAPEIGLTALGGAVALVIGGVLVARGKRAKAPPPSERSR
jgi:hypothetical protein